MAGCGFLFRWGQPISDTGILPSLLSQPHCHSTAWPQGSCPESSLHAALTHLSRGRAGRFPEGREAQPLDPLETPLDACFYGLETRHSFACWPPGNRVSLLSLLCLLYVIFKENTGHMFMFLYEYTCIYNRKMQTYIIGLLIIGF